MLLSKEDSILLLVDVQEKLSPAVLNSTAFVARCEWLLTLAKQLGVPVLASEQYPQGLGSTINALSSYYDADNCFEKIHFSSMQEPNYVKRLSSFQKNQLLLIGIEAHVCVLQTALDMKDAGFEVYVVVDAVSSRHEVDLRYGLKRMKQEGVHLITAEMVFFEWLKHAGSPEFKALSKQFFGRDKS